MQTEAYYISLIKGHYNADCIYLKKKYKKSFKEIYSILENQEKKTLELQNIVIDFESQDRLDDLMRILNKRKDLFDSFIDNLFEVDTTEIIPEQLFKSIDKALSVYNKYLNSNAVKIRQESLF